MFDIGGEEFLLLVVLGLLIFGPRRLPQIGRQLGGFVGQMRAAMREFQGTLEREVALEEIKGVAKDLQGLKGDAQGIVRDVAGLSAYASGSPDPAPPVEPPPAPDAVEPPVESDGVEPPPVPAEPEAVEPPAESDAVEPPAAGVESGDKPAATKPEEKP
ncbi:MAG: Sec-independent protein translocase protein TatB [Candidatus Polarisedimenticolia bacterium]